ncbi:hypothetical protein ACEZCY_21995 [Streptacidiphilus sp. N1-12]|uniref:Uncharacterized protein n=2 Tax=Streptacidiphilus alkalitolerans TaxID=3342712 RepID=A0ABV6VDY9_9ACTN
MATASIRRALAGTTMAGAMALAGCASTGTGAAGAGTASASGSASAAGSAGSSSNDSSGDGADAANAAALQAASAATIATGSAKLALDETVQSGKQSISVTGTGSTQLSGSGSGGSSDGEFTLTAAGQSIQMRVIGKVLYEMLPPAARAKVPGQKPWVRIDLAKAAAGAGGTISAPDTSQALGYLKDAKDVTKVGTETVDGASATHYRFQAALPQNSGSMLGVSLPSSIPVDVWVDASNHIREEKIQFTVSASATGAATATASAPATGSASASAGTGAQSASTTTDLHLSGFGTPVTVTAPPSAQTTDLTGAAASAVAKG